MWHSTCSFTYYVFLPLLVYVYLYHLFVILVACVYFDPIDYTVNEGEDVAIAIVTNVSVSVPITVTVDLGGGSAGECE